MKNFLLFIRSVLVFVSAFFYASNFSFVLSSAIPSLRAWHVYVVLIVASIVLHLISGDLLKSGRVKLRYVTWFAALMGLCLMSLAIHGTSYIASETLIRYMWVAAGSSSFALLINSKRELGVAGMAIVLAITVVCSVTLLEFLIRDFVVLKDMKISGNLAIEGVRRSGGLFLNPNNNAYAMVIGMCIGVSFLPAKLRLVFALFVGCAVFATFSRSGLLLWGIAVVATGLMGQYASYRAAFNILPVILIVALGYMVVTGQARNIIESSKLDYHVSAKMLERVTGNFLAQDDDSSVVRKEMVTDGLNAFYRNPLLGDGLGSSRQFGEDGITGPHNMWIVFGIEFGILGVFLLLVSGLLVLSVHNGFANLVGAQYLIASLFSHTLLDDMFTAVLLPMGLVLIPLYSSSNRYRKRRRRQKM